MSRHPEPFEKHGITTRTLERAPLAREAFYTSDWPGARALVQSSDESKVKLGDARTNNCCCKKKIAFLCVDCKRLCYTSKYYCNIIPVGLFAEPLCVNASNVDFKFFVFGVGRSRAIYGYK